MLKENYHPEIINQEPDLSLQESVIALGMLNGDKTNTTRYNMDSSGLKKVNSIEARDVQGLIEKFRKDPKTILAIGRENIFAINQDTNLSEYERNDRLKRYIKAFLTLQIKLDRLAFPPNPGNIIKGIPNYIPDGLSDMGSDDRTDPLVRDREKIRIDKSKIYEQANELFEKVFSASTKDMSSTSIKKFIVKWVNYFVYTNMPYDWKNFGPTDSKKSLTLDSIFDEKLAVCRHQALYTQVLLQAFGLTSRLMKCNVDFDDGDGSEAHVANLVRIDSKWYLLDVTNPIVNNGEAKMFIKPIQESQIDLNNNTYSWIFNSDSGKKRNYRSRNNMYYRINDNKTPV